MRKIKKRKISTWWNIEKTEVEWQKRIDHFFFNFTPKWFIFLGWLLTLGVLKYIDLQVNSKLVYFIYVFSSALIFFFLQSIFYNFPFYKLLPEKFIVSRRFAFVFSLATAGLLLIFIKVYLLENIISQFSIK